MTNEKILAALSNVQEPDLGKDLVTLNMVKDIVIDGKNVSFTVVLTTPACPMKDMIMNACVMEAKLQKFNLIILLTGQFTRDKLHQ